MQTTISLPPRGPRGEEGTVVASLPQEEDGKEGVTKGGDAGLINNDYVVAWRDRIRSRDESGIKGSMHKSRRSEKVVVTCMVVMFLYNHCFPASALDS